MTLQCQYGKVTRNIQVSLMTKLTKGREVTALTGISTLQNITQGPKKYYGMGLDIFVCTVQYQGGFSRTQLS